MFVCKRQHVYVEQDDEEAVELCSTHICVYTGAELNWHVQFNHLLEKILMSNSADIFAQIYHIFWHLWPLCEKHLVSIVPVMETWDLTSRGGLGGGQLTIKCAPKSCLMAPEKASKPYGNNLEVWRAWY